MQSVHSASGGNQASKKDAAFFGGSQDPSLTPDAAQEKQRLRRRLREREARIPPEARQISSRRIAEGLFSLELYRRAAVVSCFVGTAREIDTLPILRDVLSAGKTLCVPLCLGRGVMEMRRIAALDALTPGTMGIPEPPSASPPVPPEGIDLALIPCLSCDTRGRRLGRGGGYYDRFLTDFPGKAVLLCREALVSPAVPVEPHDRPVPLVLTERGLYQDGVLTERGLYQDSIRNGGGSVRTVY